MSAASCEIKDVPPRDQEELLSRLASYALTTSSGTPQPAATIASTRHEQTSACWQVALPVVHSVTARQPETSAQLPSEPS